MKKKFTAAFCLLTAAAGLASCSDVDLDQFYLESIPDISIAEEDDSLIAELSSSESDESTVETAVGGPAAEEIPDSTDAAETQPPVTVSEEESPDSDPMYELSDAVHDDSAAEGDSAADSSEAETPTEPQSGIAAAFTSVLNDYAEQSKTDPFMEDGFCKYYITDMDLDGTPEMIVETGSREADRTGYVYRYDLRADKAVQISGTITSWHATFGIYGGKLGCETVTLGRYMLTTVEISDGALVTSRLDPTEESLLEKELTAYEFSAENVDLTGLEGI